MPKPLVLLAGLEAEQTPELSRALIQGGFRMVTARDEREASDAAQAHQPDAILLDAGLAAPDYRVCLKLHTLALATPILLVCPGEPTRSQQLAAFRAGAWEVLGAPLDVAALLAQLALFLEPKLELDRVGEERLLDRTSGLYTPRGLARRASELAALASRHGLTLACAVFQPAQPPPTRAADDQMAAAVRSAGRASDAIGRSGQAEFAVFAPATSTLAAARIMRRITASVEQQLGFVAQHAADVGVRSGYSASSAPQRISAPALLARARGALGMQ